MAGFNYKMAIMKMKGKSVPVEKPISTYYQLFKFEN